MTKSEFYIAWHTHKGCELSTAGYPKLSFAKHANPDDNDPTWVPSDEPMFIETEDDWNQYLLTEPEVEFLCRHDPEACEIAGVEFQTPYTQSRRYPNIGDQLDNIYKTLKTLKDAGVDLGEAGASYVDAITLIKETFPKN